MMKICLSEIQPWTFRMVCLLLGGFGVLALARARGSSLAVSRSEAGPLLLVALLNVTAWHLLSAHGLIRMEAGRATIVAFTMPLWSCLLGRVVLREPLTGIRILALALGMGGLFLLLWRDLKVIGGAPVGAFFMVGAAVSWAAGTIFIKRYHWSMPTSVLTGWQLLVGSPPVVAGAILLEPLEGLLQITPQAAMALLYVVVVAMIFCHLAWFAVVRIFPAAVASIGTLLIPIVGVVSSAFVLDEPLGFHELGALGLVISAVATLMIRPASLRGEIPRPVQAKPVGNRPRRS
jgi:drug/metabolite transporter (DMT)-like permease